MIKIKDFLAQKLPQQIEHRQDLDNKRRASLRLYPSANRTSRTSAWALEISRRPSSLPPNSSVILSFSSMIKRSAVLRPMPETLVKTLGSSLRMPDFIMLRSDSDITERASFGPTPETVSRSSKNSSSGNVVNPKSEIWSSRTWVWMYKESFLPGSEVSDSCGVTKTLYPT